MRVRIKWVTSGVLLLSTTTLLLLVIWCWSSDYRALFKESLDVPLHHSSKFVARADRREEKMDQVDLQLQEKVPPTLPAKTSRKLVDLPVKEVIKVALKYSALLNPPRGTSNVTQSGYLKSYTTTADTYLQRKKTFAEACKKHGHLLQKVNKVQVLWLKQYAMTLCLIEKCGSTFMGQLLYLLYGQAPQFYSPFQVHAGYVYGFYHSIRSVLTDAFNQTSVRHAIFVRDPYPRLFSGYIDKFFTTSISFWVGQGRSVVAFNRNATAGKRGNYFGHDVTFAELARYIIANIEKDSIDPHFTPLYSKHCVTCDVSYDIIGKAETSGDDLAYFLDSIGLIHNNITVSNPGKERVYQKIIDKLGHLWRSVEAITHYMPLRNAMLRVWRSFQIEGLISVAVQCPTGVELLPFEEAVQVTLAHYDPQPNVKAQKKEALVQAYLSLTEADLLSVQKILEPDADMFGYSAWPSAIFEDRERKRQEMASRFQYFDVFDKEKKRLE